MKCLQMFNPQPKPVKKPKKKKRSMLEFFLEIWDERPHKSEISGDPLLPKGHPKWHFQFLHVLGKQAFPKFKLEKWNIILALPGEHDDQEQYEIFRNRRDELKELYHKTK